LFELVLLAVGQVMSLIATRQLEDVRTGNSVVVSLNAPEQQPDGVWECRYTISELGLAPFNGRAFGEDGFQAIALALEAIRIDLRDMGRKFSWLGGEPGITGFSRVPYLFGSKLVEELEAHIDARVDQFSEEAAAGLHGPPFSDSVKTES